LTRQLLAYAGKRRYTSANLDVNQVIRSHEYLLAAALPAQVRLTLDLTPGLPPVYAGEAQIPQVLMNLVVNAGEAVANGAGQVCVRTALEQITAASALNFEHGLIPRPGPYVVLQAIDSNSGMTPDTRTRAFEPFFSTRFPGRGLSLSAVLGIVRGHRGGLCMDSTPDHGTTVTVFWPAAEPSEVAQPVPIPEPAAREPDAIAVPDSSPAFPATILIVDDDAVVLDALGDILRLCGYQVLTACHGAEAMTIVSGSPGLIRLVILDLVMPIMDGTETLRALRSIESSLPILLCSGFDDEETESRLVAGQVSERPSAFLQKPYRLRAVTNAVQKLLNQVS
jgi:CheY-like chemotaxis protein